MTGIGDSGFTIEQLGDYLDAGRSPAIPAIDTNAECQAVLASLERYGSLSRDLVARDALEAPVDESWFGSLLTEITREVKAGRDLPLASVDPRTRLSITEGAVREFVRAAGDAVDGVLVGRCTLTSTEVGVSVAVTISVQLGTPVRAAAETVRQAVYTELLKHTELLVDSVDVTVADVHVVTPEDS